MVLKRMGLLILGLAGSIIVSVVLYASAGATIVGVPPATNVTEPLQEDISARYDLPLPFVVTGTTLLAQVLTAYEGPFLEDGTDREVVDIAALQICNIGNKLILNAHIELQLDGISYIFYGEHFPPGIPVLLLECNGQKYQKTAITDCIGWQVASAEVFSVKPKVSVKDMPLGTLAVSNLTEKTLYNVCLYYKTWLSPPGICVGGITYCVNIPMLKPGQTEYLYPHHFASGFSKVVYVKTD